jgi:hypothetical protein
VVDESCRVENFHNDQNSPVNSKSAGFVPRIIKMTPRLPLSWQRDPITSYDVVVPRIPVYESSVLILLQLQNYRHTQRVLGTESVSCVDKLNFLTRVGKPQASFVLCIEARCRGPYEWRFLTITTATRALCG